MKQQKSIAVSIIAFMTMTQMLPLPLTQASSISEVVINEIAWMGTLDDSNDEWLELYNNTDQEIDLLNWYIEDDDSSKYTLSGKIEAHGFFLIEDTEEAVNSLQSDAIINLSLANSGDKLVLKNNTGDTIDIVNNSGGEWFAGDNTEKMSMERIDPESSGDDVQNWDHNEFSNGATGRSGSLIQGTPGSKNSVALTTEEITMVELKISNATPNQGEIINVAAEVTNVKNLFSYGLNIVYDPTVLEYQSIQAGSFLSENATISTSFQVGLEDGKSGTLIVAEARTTEIKEGINGNGTLFSMNFKVIGEVGTETQWLFDAGSFLSDFENDITTKFTTANITVTTDEGGSTVKPVVNVQAVQGSMRYTFQLIWEAPETGADRYNILRKDQSGNFVEIGSTENLKYIDEKKIIPTVTYSYRVIAIKGDVESTPVEVSVMDERGLIGDNNRSDRVDGRDLEKLARHFSLDSNSSAFDALVDTTYDGRIDGKDLIDMAANWALNYQG